MTTKITKKIDLGDIFKMGLTLLKNSKIANGITLIEAKKMR